MSPYATEDTWFRIGRLQVTTTIAVVLLGAVGMLSWVFYTSMPSLLAYAPQLLSTGQVWRVFTWPMADGLSLWSILTLVMLWYFGSDLESRLGKIKMAWLFGGIWLGLTLATSITGFLFNAWFAAAPQLVWIGGMSTVQLVVLLIWIAEYPTRRFFFSIPAWVFGSVIVLLQVLQYVGMRQWPMLVNLVLSLILVAIVARSLGLLTDYAWIPGGNQLPRPRKTAATSTRAQQREHRRRMSDDERMDELLDKINAQGLHSLTKSERAEMLKLRERRR